MFHTPTTMGLLSGIGAISSFSWLLSLLYVGNGSADSVLLAFVLIPIFLTGFFKD